ncbi:MAG: dienelactone hydrolase family protein [Chloroflexi bacterium]|nr:dienelactone hydrolase family protein [Chloroflexota bacterium]
MSTQRRIPYEGMLAETVSFPGNNGDIIGGYLARPLGSGPYPGVILIHEVFGLVEHTKELARKFAAHGYITIAPDLYYREGPGDLEQIVAAIRQSGGIPDAQAIGDLGGAAAALLSMVTSNGKIGCIGHCSGGRHTLLFACNTRSLSAAVDCYGGRVVTEELTPKQPKAVIDMIAGLNCPLLGLFGESDANPSPQHVARLEAELKKQRKQYEFKSYPPDTGHGFFADHRPSYRQESAVDGWQRIFAFFGRYLS